MHSFTLCLALLAGGQASYGPLDGLKILKPADTQDHPTTPAPAGAVVLFDGKSTEAFQHRDGKSPIGWKVTPEGFLEVKGGDIVTKEKFSTPMHLHVEFRVPYMPKASGQGRGNSGVYVQGRYEVQVLDSYGLDSKDNDCGGIYGVAKPLVNACKAPTVWQAYDIDFTPPVFEGGKKIEGRRDHREAERCDHPRPAEDHQGQHHRRSGWQPRRGRPDFAAGSRQPGSVPEHLGGEKNQGSGRWRQRPERKAGRQPGFDRDTRGIPGQG